MYVSAETKVMHKACEPFNILLNLITFYQPNASQQHQPHLQVVMT
jgi:hypothetical protein